MMRISRKGALAACLTTAAAAAAAQSGSGWHGIGQAAAPPDAASVTIAVSITARGETHNREIMFCVEGHVMRFASAVLHFEGGGTQSVRINERVADGGCSRGTTLSGHSHAVESADVTYDQAILAGGTARVQLFVR
jgi:hypothetical protein